ncbi:MAG TPA: AAA family ATPase [Dehalococcoidia bacterium]|nr:AAA family ATPase [Dehalococcoidia bacterium]
MPLRRLELTNFLSYRETSVEFGGLTALVGPNASGKSNAAAALKLLRDIPEYGLQTALLRRGGFDQLRHRSEGRPFDPKLAVEFEVDGGFRGNGERASCSYELELASVAGGRYAVKLERAVVELGEGRGRWEFTQKRGKLEIAAEGDEAWFQPRDAEPPRVPEGQTALNIASSFGPFFMLWSFFSSLQVVEINPARVRDLQDPTPGYDFEPDGSNCASVFEGLPSDVRTQLIDDLAAIVPNLVNIEVRRFSNKMTLSFHQRAGSHARIFLANQMSDGTLRAFAILLALYQPQSPSVLLVEEPEVAIHLGALQTLVEVLEQHSADSQIVLTTHSADIIDALDIEALRVVWAEDGISHIGQVAAHTKETVRTGLITPGELLRSDSLDPAPV